MVAYRAAAEVQRARDIGRAGTANEEAADIDFAFGERIVGAKEDVLGQLRIDDTQAGVDAADGIGQLVWGSVFD